MIDPSITEEVLSLTFNSDSFPMATGIPLEKIKLADPKNIPQIKRILREQEIKMVLIDGTMWRPIATDIVNIAKRVRRRFKLNIVICIINQDDLEISDTVWEQNPENAKKYLRA